MMVTLVQTTVGSGSCITFLYYVHVWTPPKSKVKMKTVTCRAPVTHWLTQEVTNTLDLRLRVTTWTNHCVYNAKLQSDKHKPFITNAVKDIIPSSHLSDIPPEPPSCVMTVMYFKSCHWSMLTTFAVLVSR